MRDKEKERRLRLNETKLEISPEIRRKLKILENIKKDEKKIIMNDKDRAFSPLSDKSSMIYDPGTERQPLMLKK